MPEINLYTPEVLSTILWFIWGLALLVFLIISLVFIYHWRRYGRLEKATKKAEIIYFLGGVFFLGLAALTIFLI